MKINKMLSLDLEIVLLLNKEKNQSQLVGGLLRNYFTEQLNKDIKQNEEK